ncbi:MAG: hypothetical protein J1G06_04815 [Oscillospiraceae bacterium]|nr:hypothetical protein [Oscillospiraceae bacterium]
MIFKSIKKEIPQPISDAPILIQPRCLKNKVLGELKVYPDRLEFKGTLEGKELSTQTYYMRDIAKVNTFLMNGIDIIFTMKNGKRVRILFWDPNDLIYSRSNRQNLIEVRKNVLNIIRYSIN